MTRRPTWSALATSLWLTAAVTTPAAALGEVRPAEDDAPPAAVQAAPEPAAAPTAQPSPGTGEVAAAPETGDAPPPPGGPAGATPPVVPLDSPLPLQTSDVPLATSPAQPTAVPPTTTIPLPAPEAHEKIQTLQPSLLSSVVATEKERWEADQGGYIPSRLAIARRLSERPSRLLSRVDALPRERDAFLWRIARDTWRGLQAYLDRENGLIIDNVRIVGGLVPPLAVRVGDYTNITNIGLQLIANVAARQLGLLPDTDARAASLRVLDTLARLERHDGYFFNYYDTTSLEATSSFVSFVDTAWLVAGLIVTRQGFPELEGVVNQLLAPLDLHYFYDDSTGLMSHGYYVNLGTLSAFEYGHFYTEARLGSLIAIGKGDAPARHWYAMRRASRSRCVNGDCPTMHRVHYQARDGSAMSVWNFHWRDFEYVPSWGGSMFEALMPRLVIDEDRWAPRSLGQNGRAHALVQKLYATEILGWPVWGMSPCMSPRTQRYGEFGVGPLGSHGYAEGVVTPHAAALALAVAPDDATEALRELAGRYDVYGPFGFYDAVDPVSGQVAYDQLALDQLMLFLAVANHLTGDEVPALFASDPWIRPALPLLAEERFFE